MHYAAIVNALIPSVELPAVLIVERVAWAEVERALAEGTLHYVRHLGTAKLLGAPPNDGFYEPRIGDVYLVMRLKSGVALRGAEVEARADDLDILRVEVRNA